MLANKLIRLGSLAVFVALRLEAGSSEAYSPALSLNPADHRLGFFSAIVSLSTHNGESTVTNSLLIDTKSAWTFQAFAASVLKPITNNNLTADGDCNGDGRTNLQEYAFGNETQESLTLQRLPSGDYVLDFSARLTAVDLVYVIEISRDLKNWSSLSTEASTLEVLEWFPGGPNRYRSIIPEVVAEGQTVFIRLTSDLQK